MKTTLIFFLSLIIFVFTFSKQLEAQVLEVSSGDTLNNIVAQDVQYAFDDFTSGTVFYKGGETSKGRLNYNYLTGEMQFLAPKSNKILAISNVPDIVVVAINNRHFIPAGNGSGFLELLVKGDTRLAVNRKAKVLSEGKTGAYGVASSTASIESVSHIQRKGEAIALSVNENVRVTIDNSYYLESNGKKTLINGIKAYAKFYPKEVLAIIEKYIADNKISFKKEADLIKLTEYCNQL